MTRDDIIRLAREVWTCGRGLYVGPSEYSLERFAALVAASEREACAKVCEEWAASGAEYSLLDAIRARGAND